MAQLNDKIDALSFNNLKSEKYGGFLELTFLHNEIFNLSYIRFWDL